MPRYGTTVFYGMDSQSSPHLLQDGELTVADNVNYAKHGAVKCLNEDLMLSPAAAQTLHHLGVGIAVVAGHTRCIFKVQTAPATYRIYWFNVGQAGIEYIPDVVWGDGVLRVYQGPDSAILTDGTYMRVWDGEILRSFGPPPAGTGYGGAAEVFHEKEITASTIGFDIGAYLWNYGGLESTPGVLYARRRQMGDTQPAHGLTGGESVIIKRYTLRPDDDQVTCVDPTEEEAAAEYLRDNMIESNTWTTSLDHPGAPDGDGSPIAEDGVFRIVEGAVPGDPLEGGGYARDFTEPRPGNIYEKKLGTMRVLTDGMIPCGLYGEYRYGLTYTLEMPDGTVLESPLEPIYGTLLEDAEPDKAAESFTIDVNDAIRLVIPRVTDEDIDAYLWELGGYTLGAEILCGIRIYRTKMNGAFYYILHEYEHADAYDDTAGGVSEMLFDDSVPDIDLGALYSLPEGIGYPPLFRDAVLSSNVLYAINLDDPQEVHFSLPGDLEYWHPLSFVKFPEVVTGLAAAAGHVAIFSQRRCWLYDNDDGIGYLEEVPVQLGVADYQGAISYQNNIYFGNALGLWELSGRRVSRVSMPVDDQWQSHRAADMSWAGGAVGDLMVWAPSTSQRAFTINLSGGEVKWGTVLIGTETGYYSRFVPVGSLNALLTIPQQVPQAEAGLWQLSGGEEKRPVAIRSKQFGSGLLGRCRRLWLDASADVDGHAWVVSNLKESPPPVRVQGKGELRTMLFYNLPIYQGEFWTLAFEGTGEIYGWWVEVDENDPAY